MPNLITLVLGALLAAAVTLVDATSFGIYHLSARQAAANNCSFVRLPWNFCPACKLKPFTVLDDVNDVDFGGVNRFDIYDLSDPSCMAVMQKYVDENPCDTVRANALAKINTPAGYRVMIYFMYSICEACCDCVPIGAREDEYEERKKNGTLISIFRGNCPAHYYYDTCRVWPQVGQIGNLRATPRNNSKVWCPDFKDWQFSNFSRRWLRNPAIEGSTWLMRRGMNQLMRAARCTEEQQWKKCVRMELGQKRI